MAETKIQWTERTWNPVRGCSMAKGSEATECLNCYAARMAARGLPGMNSPTTGEPFAIMRPSGPRWTGKVELISSMLDVPLKRRKPTTWFVNSMSDLFHENLSDEDVYRCFAVMELAHWHTFQILTKRAERLPKLMARIYGGANMGRILPNVWLGTSIGVRSTLHRVDDLRETPAAVRFLSLEPLLEELGTLDLHGIDWVIVGGESGPGARPCDVDWIRAIVAQCKAARVACFVKQLGALVIGSYGDVVRLKDPKGGDPAEWPEDLRVREVPRG